MPSDLLIYKPYLPSRPSLILYILLALTMAVPESSMGVPKEDINMNNIDTINNIPKPLASSNHEGYETGQFVISRGSRGFKEYQPERLGNKPTLITAEAGVSRVLLTNTKTLEPMLIIPAVRSV
jgi:hypothetical protein